MKRVQYQYIFKDLSKKMVLLTGPRQVGKTYLAKQLAHEFTKPVYLNYDNLQDKKIIEEQAWLNETDFLILDELHKMPDWKNYLKGVFDTKPSHLHILVTGSARLEFFEKLGDSLAGRYFLHRLLPLSPAEFSQENLKYDLNTFLERGGFPEPYFASDLVEANRWRLQYVNSLLTTDVFDFDKIQNIRAIRTLFELLKTRVGSPISYQSLAEDIAVSPVTVKKYIEILEALYVIFRITPYSKNIARSLLKEPKIYFFDNGLVSNNEGAQFENLIATSLLKHVYAKVDYHAEDYALHYLRTKDGLEVDFALVKNGEIEKIVEVKNTDKEISKTLFYFHQKHDLQATQVVKNIKKERMAQKIAIVNANSFLTELFL